MIVRNMFFIQLLICISIVNTGVYAYRCPLLDQSYDHNLISVYKFLDTQKSSYIVFIKDNEDKHYVVKQEKNPSLNKQFRAMAEALCAYVAQTVSIPSQEVYIIPMGVPFPGKFITKRVATLHTRVPGSTIRSLPDGRYAKLDIKQSTDVTTPSDRQGFNQRTIFWMSRHKDLPSIVAFDSFFGNKDRNKANIFYDPVSDRFYSIDMALMYDVFSARRSVAQVGCEQLLLMIKNNVTFNSAEIKGLRAYRDMLRQLVQLFPPKKMCELVDMFFNEMAVVTENSQSQKDIAATLELYKRAIKKTYVDIKKLIYLLLILIEQQA